MSPLIWAKDKLQAHLAESLLGVGMLSLITLWLSTENYFATLLPVLQPVWAVRAIAVSVLSILVAIATYLFFRPKLQFHEPTGTWIDRKTNLRYCAKCKSKKLRSPLRNGDRGWSCPVCTAYWPDPARKGPESPATKNLGPQSWMA